MALNTARVTFTLSPKGFFILTSPTGAILGMLTASMYSNGTAFLGFFVLDPSIRGQGLGGALFGKCLDYVLAQGIKTVGLDAVQDQVGTYGRRGFKDCGQKVVMYERQPTISDSAQVAEEVTDIKQASVSALAEMDYQHTGFRRDALWKILLEQADLEGWAIEKNGELKAMIVARKTTDGWKIGPLYAEEPEHAQSLLQHTIRELGDEVLKAEVWVQNNHVEKLLQVTGWTKSFVMSVGVSYDARYVANVQCRGCGMANLLEPRRRKTCILSSTLVVDEDQGEHYAYCSTTFVLIDSRELEFEFTKCRHLPPED